MKAVFLDRGSFPDHINIQLPVKVIDVVTYENTPIELVAERIKDANIVLTNKVVVDATAINGTADLKLVQVMATGTNNIDLDACKDKNISVQNVSGYSTTSVPEHTFAMLLALRRSLFSYLDAVKAGRWSSSEYFCFLDYPIKDLSGSTMAIFGNGSLGKEVAAIALAFGMKVVFAERKGATNTRPGYICFEEALKVADVININCPLTPETKDLISDDEFSLMKNSCLLLNISRGGIVDESALVRAFENNAIAGAAFDVATQEPMPLDNPLQSLSKRPNFLLTPHVAWASDEAMQTLVDMAMDKITSFIDKR
jgi:glycerate dehydrogenase